MDFRKQIIANSVQLHQTSIPHISLDTVIFGFDDGKLKVLLLKMNFNKQWFLPGGYILKDENINKAAQRILKERAGVNHIFLKEFAVFGDQNRTQGFFDDYDDDLWHKMRFVTIGFYALVNYADVKASKDDLSESIDWIDLDSIDDIPLTMDHAEIIKKALWTLRTEISYQPIGINLLPEKFTLPELQKLYETILGRTLNRGNFYRKIKNMGILTKHDERKVVVGHKAPDLYSFDLIRYNQILQEGVNNW